jgi:predicted transcriptional regulator
MGGIMAKSSGDEQSKLVVEELINIKKLLMFGLLRSGASQLEIAKALGVNQSSVSRMLPGIVGQRKRT